MVDGARGLTSPVQPANVSKPSFTRAAVSNPSFLPAKRMLTRGRTVSRRSTSFLPVGPSAAATVRKSSSAPPTTRSSASAPRKLGCGCICCERAHFALAIHAEREQRQRITVIHRICSIRDINTTTGTRKGAMESQTEMRAELERMQLKHSDFKEENSRTALLRAEIDEENQRLLMIDIIEAKVVPPPLVGGSLCRHDWSEPPPPSSSTIIISGAVVPTANAPSYFPVVAASTLHPPAPHPSPIEIARAVWQQGQGSVWKMN